MTPNNLSANFKFKILVGYDKKEKPIYRTITRKLNYNDLTTYSLVLSDLFVYFEFEATDIDNLPF